jgi:hypothetical protein
LRSDTGEEFQGELLRSHGGPGMIVEPRGSPRASGEKNAAKRRILARAAQAKHPAARSDHPDRHERRAGCG